MDTDRTSEHAEWVRQIEAEVEGELSLAQRAALARHLVGCPHCAGTRASHLEMRAAMAAAAGDPQARAVPRFVIGWRTVVLVVLLGLVAGTAAGWLAHRRWGAPGQGSLEAGRATIVAP
jgi:anti-sigma factor RsiW